MNLLVTGAWGSAEEHIPELERRGHSVSYLQYETDTLPCPCDWVEGVICNGLFLYHPIEEFPNLRFIQLTSAGFDRVPMEYIRAHDIKIHNARGVYSVPMAEFAVCGVLQIYKQSAFFRENRKLRRWEKHRDLMELNGKTVCVIGCGSVGTECAKRFQAFGCRVTGIATTGRSQAFFDAVLPSSELDQILPTADIVILALPRTDETDGLLNADRIARMKPGATLVNIARGALVDEAALIAALKERRLFGAVLDVFETEPLPADSPLWDMDNVIVTPHNSFVGEGNAERLTETIMAGLE